MVQLVKYGSHFNTNVMRIDGLSAETKPVDKFDGMAIPNGSIYTEIDTGDKYMFDAENKVWYKVSKNYVSLDEHGFVPLENLPPEIYERMYGVADDDARFDLTTDEVQNGDVVFVNDTQIMYLVVDDTKLDSEDGYQEFAAGIAGKAIADEDGRNIKNTYLTEEEYNAGKTLPELSSVTVDGQSYVVGRYAEVFNHYGDNGNAASGFYSHAEGSGTAATANSSHAEGGGTRAMGSYSHAEGSASFANGDSSHSEGYGTTASGAQSHAQGFRTIAASENQHAEGKFNIEDANGKYAHIIGNGANANNRSNAYAIDWDGKIYTHNSATGFDINSNYLEMQNGIRLYISDTEPTGTIPEGSLGIGF